MGVRAPAAGVVAGLDIAISGGNGVHAGAPAGLDITQVVADVNGLSGGAAQLATIAQQRLGVRLALRHVIGAHHAAGWRLHRQLRQQRFGIGPGLVGGDAPAYATLLQFNEQFVDARVGAGHGAQHLAVQRQQAQPLGFETVCILRHIQRQAHQRPGTVGHRGANALRIHRRATVLSLQRLHHDNEFVGGVHQGAVQVEDDRPQRGRSGYYAPAHAGFTARTM